MILLTPYKNRDKIWNKYFHYLYDYLDEKNMRVIAEEDNQ